MDAEGNKLDVELNPKEVTVTIPVTPVLKEVPIVLNQAGTGDANLNYELGISNQSATTVAIQAEAGLLDSLSSYPVDIDVTDITKTTKQTIELPVLEGVTAIEPEKIEVTVTVTEKKSQENNQNTTESNQSSSSSSSSSSESNSSNGSTQEESEDSVSESSSTSSSEGSVDSSSESNEEENE
jgi:YbbR domain-containing protein